MKLIITEGQYSTLLSILVEGRLEDLRGEYVGKQPQGPNQKEVTSGDFDKIAQADPTKKNSYTQWMLNLFQSGKLQLSDLGKATEYLQTFKDNIRNMPVKNINQKTGDSYHYDSLAKLYDAVKDYVGKGQKTVSKIEFLRKQYVGKKVKNPEKQAEITEDVFKKIAQADPTGNNAYTQWMLDLFYRKQLKLEDLYKATEYLQAFDTNKSNMAEKDINKKVKTAEGKQYYYASLGKLYDAVAEFLEGDEEDESRMSASQLAKHIKGKEADRVFEDSEWIVVVPKTERASCYYGKGTKWCTAADQANNMFDSYSSKGTLYININKKTGEKYQFHFETSQYMDVHDKRINTKKFFAEKGPQLIEFYVEKYIAARKKIGEDPNVTKVFGYSDLTEPYFDKWIDEKILNGNDAEFRDTLRDLKQIVPKGKMLEVLNKVLRIDYTNMDIIVLNNLYKLLPLLIPVTGYTSKVVPFIQNWMQKNIAADSRGDFKYQMKVMYGWLPPQDFEKIYSEFLDVLYERGDAKQIKRVFGLVFGSMMNKNQKHLDAFVLKNISRRRLPESTLANLFYKIIIDPELKNRGFGDSVVNELIDQALTLKDVGTISGVLKPTSDKGYMSRIPERLRMLIIAGNAAKNWKYMMASPPARKKAKEVLTKLESMPETKAYFKRAADHYGVDISNALADLS